MTTPIWLQSLKDSPDPGTKEFAKLFDTVPYSRVRDQINRSPEVALQI